MLEHPAEKKLAAHVAALVHKKDFKSAAQAVDVTCGLGLNITDDDPKNTIPVLQNYMMHLLSHSGVEEAVQILWTPNQFSPEPESTRQVWKLFDEATQGLIMGGASLSKSFSLGVRLFVEWLRDPEWTTIRVIGPSEDHLEQNLFSDLVRLHQTASLPMPGEVGDLYIGLDRRNQTSAIRGLVIPVGQNKKSGRLQGTKRKPRPEPHPDFGPLSRLFIMVDEFENVPQGLWKDIDNILSQVTEEGYLGGFKIFGAYNPNDQTNEVGKRAEPPFGWENFDVDAHYRWTSIRGWEVLRLDGERCENVVQGRTVFPGMQTRAGLEAIARNAGGRQSAGYYTMGRGAYPPRGVELTIIPAGMLPKLRGEFVWYEEPQPVGSVDTALEGGAACVFTLGKFGRASGMKLPPSLEHPNGHTVMFKNDRGEVTPRWATLAEQQFLLAKGDTIKVKDEIISLCRKAGIKPHFFAIDRTGTGSGVADLIKYEWSSAIHAVNYSEGASESRMMLEDTKTCKEEYDRVCSELWFGLRAFGEYGYFLIHPAMDMSKLAQQLTQRKFKTGGKSRVESKKDYISRGFSSPDEADSLTLLLLAVRRGSGIVPSMRGRDVEAETGTEDEWFYITREMRGGAYIDASNRHEHLDDA